MPEETYLALAGPGLPGCQPQDGRLARTVGAEQRGHTGPDVEGDIRHGDEVAEL